MKLKNKTQKMQQQIEEEQQHIGYQVLVCNIAWSSKRNSRTKNSNEELPNQLSLDIPTAVLSQAKKSKNEFNDIIEQFIYNLLHRKFGRIANRCQIWLPLEED